MKTSFSCSIFSVPITDKSIECRLPNDILSLEDIKNQNIALFKENLSRHDIKLLRNRQFVIKDQDPNAISTIKLSRSSLNGSPQHSINHGQFSNFMPARERTNVFKMIEIAEKREAAIQNMRKLQGFEFIMLNRKDILKNKLKQSKEHSLKSHHHNKYQNNYKYLQDSVDASFDKRMNEVTQQKNVDKFLNSSTQFSSVRKKIRNRRAGSSINYYNDSIQEDSIVNLHSVRPESVQSKCNDYELPSNPEITKQRVKCFARLMSAKAGGGKDISEFRRFIHNNKNDKEQLMQTSNSFLAVSEHNTSQYLTCIQSSWELAKERRKMHRKIIANNSVQLKNANKFEFAYK